MKDTLINLVQRLLRKNNISFDKDELDFQIQSHPSYPSLHAITGVLDHFNIENVAADVPVTSETLSQLPNCFLAQINTSQGNDLVVVEKSKLQYLVFNSDNKKEKLSEKDFLTKFTGIIVAVEKTEETVQSRKEDNAIKILALAVLLGSFSFVLYKASITIYTLGYLILSITGIIISIAIIKQELGLKTSIGNAFCGGIDEKKDCDAVLTSKGAEIIKGYKLSDLSILYFSVITLLTLIQITSPQISYTLSLFSIPVTLYSIYYQYKVIKKWCLLCLSIVGILWLQAAIPLVTNSFASSFTLNDMVAIGVVASITWLVWNSIKPLVTEVTTLKKEKIESVKFKRNFTLFNSLLQKSPRLHTEIPGSKEIIFGNTNASLELTVITNPFCGHCKPVHKHIDKILQRYHNTVKVNIRFNINTNDLESDAVKITSRLLEIHNEEREKNCLKAMGDIYEGVSPVKWESKWGKCTEKENYIMELEREKKWCQENAINFTPEILINGKSFPKEYNRTDLILFIEELEENCQELATI